VVIDRDHTGLTFIPLDAHLDREVIFDTVVHCDSHCPHLPKAEAEP
jgi:hypothetical protein